MNVRIVAFILVGALVVPALAVAQPARWIGVAVAAAGAAMMTLDPEQPVQPTQPGTVADDTLHTKAIELLTAELTPGLIRSLRRATGVPVLNCEPFCVGDIDEAILGSFAVGAAAGVVATTEVGYFAEVEHRSR